MAFPKLKGRIVEKYGTLGKFCDAYGMSVSNLSYKLNHSKMFNTVEIEKMCELLEIPKTEIADYFFCIKC